jgi:multiple sugar transport system permease protein
MKSIGKRKYGRAERLEWFWGYLLILPNFIGFLIFFAIPVFFGLVVSVTNYNGFKIFDFVGFSNFIQLFNDKFFIIALKNNLFYSLLYVPLVIFFALVFALAVDRIKLFNGLYRTIFYFPSITSIVAIGIVWSIIMHPTNGPLNTFLRFIGFQNPPKWIAASSTALISIIIIMAWKNAGYYMIMFLGGLKTIPAQLYEAARLDGAKGLQLFFRITWPMLSPITFMVFIFCFISSFQVFDAINIMTQGGPGTSTSIIVLRIYQEGFIGFRFGYASAMAYFLFLIIMFITMLQFLGQKKWVNYE